MKKLFLILFTSLSLISSQVRQWSLVDPSDLTDTVFIAPTEEATLHLFLVKHQSTLEKDWEDLQQELDPLIDQAYLVGTTHSSSYTTEPPLVFAAKRGLLSFVRYVLEDSTLEKDKKVLAQALHGAVLYDHTEVTQLLLNYGANPNSYIMYKTISYQTTLDAVFGGFYPATPPKKNPNYTLAKQLVLKGALMLRILQEEDLQQAWLTFLEKCPEAKKAYIHWHIAGTSKPSLQDLAGLALTKTPNGELQMLPEELQIKAHLLKTKLSGIPLLDTQHD